MVMLRALLTWSSASPNGHVESPVDLVVGLQKTLTEKLVPHPRPVALSWRGGEDNCYYGIKKVK